MSRPAPGLLQGTVDVLILEIVSRTPLHGYGISLRLRDETDGVLLLEDAALYQALHRMEAKEWLRSEWGRSDTNRRVKVYHLTPAGVERLAQAREGWMAYADAVRKVLGGS